MLATYNRIALKAYNCGDELHVFMGSNDKAGLEWNQYIGSVIINDFIKQLDEYD